MTPAPPGASRRGTRRAGLAALRQTPRPASASLDHRGRPEAGAHLLAAVEDVLAHGPAGAPRTPGLHGFGTTVELGRAIAGRVREI
ncbi:hypothetical protein [Actinoplanes sp. RD1]|uniref:hypothetical protein n=1 Tax=Actinoplanes sp. RD1 TaxID=3064538 RepID=UPI002741D249|nr:hypothetical protein [Actinoplanes sp. RD1]